MARTYHEHINNNSKHIKHQRIVVFLLRIVNIATRFLTAPLNCKQTDNIIFSRTKNRRRPRRAEKKCSKKLFVIIHQFSPQLIKRVNFFYPSELQALARASTSCSRSDHIQWKKIKICCHLAELLRRKKFNFSSNIESEVFEFSRKVFFSSKGVFCLSWVWSAWIFSGWSVFGWFASFPKKFRNNIDRTKCRIVVVVNVVDVESITWSSFCF